jgi:hypothetical protein
MRSGRRNFKASGDDLAGFVGGDEAFEDAEVCADGEVVIGDEDGAEDGRERR